MNTKTLTLSKVSKASLVTFLAAAVLILFTQNVQAYEGKTKKEYFKKDGYNLKDRRFFKKHKDFRARYDQMPKEEIQKLKSLHRERMKKRKAKFESFVGKTKEEIAEARKDGATMGQILEESGKTKEDAQQFLADRGEEKLAHIKQKKDISPEKEQKIRNKINSFVQRILGRWFS